MKKTALTLALTAGLSFLAVPAFACGDEPKPPAPVVVTPPAEPTAKPAIVCGFC